MKKAVTLITLLSSVVLGGCQCGRRMAGWPEPGIDFFAVSPESVTEVVYTSAERKLFAFRWNTNEPFQVIYARRDEDPQMCTAGDGFARWLRTIARIPVEGQAVRGFPTQGEWADVQLRDTSGADANEITLRLPASDNEPVLIRFADRVYVVGVDSAALVKVSAGCAELGELLGERR